MVETEWCYESRSYWTLQGLWVNLEFVLKSITNTYLVASYFHPFLLPIFLADESLVLDTPGMWLERMYRFHHLHDILHSSSDSSKDRRCTLLTVLVFFFFLIFQFILRWLLVQLVCVGNFKILNVLIWSKATCFTV